MRRWMSNNGLSVKEAKKRIRGCNQIQSTPRCRTTLKFSALRTEKPHRVDNVWT